MMSLGLFQLTRTNGTTSVCEIACSIGRTLFISLVPCWRSTVRASKPPWRAITSAEKLWPTDSQPMVAHFLAAQISLIFFFRMADPPVYLSIHRARSNDPFQLLGGSIPAGGIGDDRLCLE